MSRYGLLINYQWCSGCHSCELSCRTAKQLPLDQWGIKLSEVGPFKISEDKTEWNFVPIPTSLCDLCRDRVAEGRQPACVHNCLANCMEFGTVEELAVKMPTLGEKVAIYIP